ncbi:hypothetical protein [Enterococcus sp. DIV0800]|uniref:hypothetical protein n=1 Tax=unclassified Enterococcus TaxID=2608891 RepID=UPI003D2F9D53
MDITNIKKFEAQMEFLKTAIFFDFLKKRSLYFLLIPVIAFLADFMNGITWWTVVKAILLLLIEGFFFYWTYHFFKRIATNKQTSILKGQLFFGYFFNLTLFWFIFQLDFNKVFSGNFYSLLLGIGVAIGFGFTLGGIFYVCMKETLKEYLKHNTIVKKES